MLITHVELQCVVLQTILMKLGVDIFEEVCSFNRHVCTCNNESGHTQQLVCTGTFSHQQDILAPIKRCTKTTVIAAGKGERFSTPTRKCGADVKAHDIVLDVRQLLQPASLQLVPLAPRHDVTSQQSEVVCRLSHVRFSNKYIHQKIHFFQIQIHVYRKCSHSAFDDFDSPQNAVTNCIM